MNQDKPKRPRKTGSIFQMAGSANWWIKYYRNGQPIRESSGSDKKTIAQNLLTKRFAEMENSTWLSPKDKRTTVDDIYSALLTKYRNNGNASLEGAEQRWQRQPNEGEPMPEPGRLKKFFGGMRASNVTTKLLNRYVSECLDAGLGKGTINRDLSALRRAFTLALKAGEIQKVPEFEMLEEPPARTGFVEEDDYQKLAAQTKELWLRALLATAYTFGFRKGELLNLKVSQVDLKEATITLKAADTKNRKPRFAVMTQDVYTLIQASITGKEKTDYVFTRGTKRILDFRGAWETLCKAAGLPGLLFHDLRRSAVRNMVRRGIPESVAMRISGHKTRDVFERYNITSDDDIRQAAQKIESGKVWAEFSQSTATKQQSGYTN